MKTFSTSGTGNQQTLSEIESDKMPIYDSVADAESDLANLEEGQIVATKDTGTELSQPVDTVQSGNLHAVTSNAVAEKFVTGTKTFNATVGVKQVTVQFPREYQNIPLVFANIYNKTVSPFAEITGVNITRVTKQEFDFRVYNNYGSTINDVTVAWLAIAQ